MHADLDLRCITVYCRADDLAPQRRRNARRQLGHLFPCLPSQDAFHKRFARLGETIEWLLGVFAAQSPGYHDSLLLLDSTPVECGRSVETTRRSELADACGYGYCRSHSRWFWGMRLHLACAADGTPRAATLTAADRPEREIALPLLGRCLRGEETIVCDKGYAGREFAEAVAALGGTILRPLRRDEQGTQPHLAPIRRRIESVFFTCKDLLNLERHGARTLRNLAVRVSLRLLALAACISLNQNSGAPAAQSPTTPPKRVASTV